MSKAFGVIVAFASVVGLTAACGLRYYGDCCSPYQAVNSLLCGCGCNIGYCGYGCESSKSPRRCRGGCCCSCCSAPGYEYGSRDADASGDGFEADDGPRGGRDSDDQAGGRRGSEDGPRGGRGSDDQAGGRRGSEDGPSGGRASDDQVGGRSGSARGADDGEREVNVGLGIDATRPGGKRGSDDQVAAGIEVGVGTDLDIDVGVGLGITSGLVDLEAPDSIGLRIGTGADEELVKVSIDENRGPTRDERKKDDEEGEFDVKLKIGGTKSGRNKDAGNTAGTGYGEPSGLDLLSKSGESLIYDPFNIIPLTKCLCLL